MMENTAMGSREATLEDVLAEIDDKIEHYKELAELNESLMALKENKHFNRVVNSGYLEGEKDRLVGLLVEPLSPASKQDFEDYTDRLHGIRHFKSFMEYAFMKSRDAQEKLEAEQEFRKRAPSEFEEAMKEEG